MTAHIFARLREAVVGIVADLASAGTLPPGLDTGKIVVEPPRDAAHGDIATNAAMVLSKPAGTNPRALATAIAEALGRHPSVVSATVAGPGFVNATLAPGVWLAELAVILAAGPAYGASTIGAGRAVNVEYVSANPTGPMHVGHARGAVFGDVLASLLVRTGFAVTREYYINDAGGQVDVLARSAHLRYREALGEAIGEIPEGFYPGDYLVKPGADLAAAHGTALRDAEEAVWLPVVRAFAIDAMMAMIRDDLAGLGVRPDVFTSERALADAGGIEAMVAKLEAEDLVYTGTLEAPKGKLPDDWEPRPQLLFRATRFGDDTDRPLQKSNGQWTYFAGDIAYHYDKYRRGFLAMIDVMGADHGGYVKRVKAAVAAVSGGAASLDVKLCQLVNLTDNGVPVKMSKRSGSFVTLRDVVEEVGRDVVRFIMLTRRNDQALDFDFAKVREQTKDNPVFYVQYAHARVCSLLRRAAEALPGVPLDRRALQEADLSRLVESSELALIRLLAGWPRLLETAAETHEPHRVAFYLYDVAATFHALWNRGQDDPSARFILGHDRALTLARLALAQAVADVVASGLAILGVTPVEEMR